MKGKAAVFLGSGVPFEIREYPLPKVEPGAILVRIRRGNICGSDLHTWRGESARGVAEKPQIIGHEMVGQVHELGAGVTTDSAGQPLKVGDRVTYCYWSPCGRCYNCLHGQPQACPRTNSRMDLSCEDPPYFQGAFAEYFYLRPVGQYVFKVPDDLPDELVAPANCALSQVFFGLHQAGVALGDTVVIQGAGGLGINAIAVAREMGAATIIVVDQYPERIELAKAFGADHVIDIKQYPTPRDRIGQVRQLTKGLGADLVAELTGVPQAAREGVGMVRAGGRYLWIGNIRGGQGVELDPSSIIRGNRTIFGIGLYEPWALYRALELLERTKNKYPFHRVLSHTFKLEEINAAFELASQGKVTRASLVP